VHSAGREVEELLGSIKVLVVEDEPSMRKVINALMQSIGVRTIYEASDAAKGLDAICNIAPDLVLLDWQMPGMSGSDFMRMVRAPGTFPVPDVPIIMLTGKSERSCVNAAVRLGVHEYLLKPVSTQALLARITSVLVKPRQMVSIGDYYGPEPRKLSSYKPESDPGYSDAALLNLLFLLGRAAERPMVAES